MKVDLYTLPSCGICHMIKTKLEERKIPFEERQLAEISESMNLDRAPVLHIINDDNSEEYIMSPSKMADWINKQA